MIKLSWPRAGKAAPKRQPHLMAGQDDYVFRRSRTLIGSVSSKVAAGAEARGRLKTDRLKLHELRMHRRRILQLLGGVLVTSTLLSWLIANLIVQPPLAFSGGVLPHTPAAAYRATVIAYFADHPLERLGFAVNSASLEAYLKQQHGEVQSLTADRTWYGAVTSFTLFFRHPLLVWQTAGKKFYVDSGGVAFTYNHFAEPAVAVTDQSGLPPDQNSAVASTRFIRFLGRMVGAVNQYKKGEVKTVIIPASTREIDLKLQGRDYIIRTQIDRDPLEQAEDIANALSFFDAKKVTPLYIDVRVEHKAFYK